MKLTVLRNKIYKNVTIYDSSLGFETYVGQDFTDERMDQTIKSKTLY